MRYYLSLGANVGAREQTLQQALQMIEQRIGSILRCSSYYYSAPWGFESENEFCNLCCAVQTTMKPLKVLTVTQDIERALGRTHKSNGHYSDRSIDIDLIRAFDEKGQEIQFVISRPDSLIPLLSLPHPLWEQRAFVYVPLKEIFD